MSEKMIEVFKEYYKRNTILHKDFDDVDDLYTGFKDGYLLAKKEDEERVDKLKKALMHYADYTNNQDNPYSYDLARRVLKEVEG